MTEAILLTSNNNVKNNWTFYIIVLAAIAGAVYYFLFYKKPENSETKLTECIGKTGVYNNRGSSLPIGSSLTSCDSFEDNGYQAAMQSDGNFIIFKKQDGSTVWDSKSSNKGTGPYTFTYQLDGNLVIHDSKHSLMWTSRSENTKSSLLKIDNAGTMATFLTGNTNPIWDTNTGLQASSDPNNLGQDLTTGQTLLVGQYILNGTDKLIYQNDNNLVFYNGSVPLWSSGTAGSPNKVSFDGNLHVYDISGAEVFKTTVIGGSKIEIMNGKLRISNSSGNAIWENGVEVNVTQ